MDWRKLKAGERVFVFPNRYPCIVISVGKPEGRDGADTKVYLRRLDSHESEFWRGRGMSSGRADWFKPRF